MIGVPSGTLAALGTILGGGGMRPEKAKAALINNFKIKTKNKKDLALIKCKSEKDINKKIAKTC